MRPFRTVRGRLLLVAALSILPLLGFFALERRQLASQAREDWAADALRLAGTAAATHVETLRRTQWLLEALARVPSLRDPDPGLCGPLFGDFYGARDYYTAFGLVGVDGRTICTVPALDTLDLSERPYFRRAVARRDLAVSDYHVGAITGRPVVTMAVPVLTTDSTVAAVLAAGIDLRRLDPLPPDVELPAGTHLTLLDASGHVLYHAPDAVPAPGDTVPTGVARMAQATSEGRVTLLDLPGFGPRYYAVVPVEVEEGRFGARVLVSFDPAMVERLVADAGSSGLWGIALGTLILIGGFWAALELVVLRRIAPVAAAADRLGHGDLDARSGVGAGDGDDEIGRLGKAFDRMAARLQEAREAEAERARRRVERSEERLRLLAETIEEVFWIWDPREGRYVYLSPAFEKIWGFPAIRLMEDVGVWLESVHPDDRDEIRASTLDSGTFPEGEHEYRIVRPDGDVRWIESRTYAVRDDDGRPERFLGVAQDVTERKELEQTLLHATRLEAVGRLAGGVAHDFNNILTAIQGHTQFMMETLPGDHEVRSDLEEIATGVRRAAGLTRQLLTFSRKQAVRPELLDPEEVVDGTAGMLHRLLGEGIELVVETDGAVPRVRADLHQLEQVVLNLAVNARDAIRDGGTVRISTGRADLPGARRVTTDVLEPGVYAMIRVSDDGVGMTAEVADRMFDPFFTTRAGGEGTGLGLSTAHGIVTEAGGGIDVDTAPGAGTTISVYLPAAGPDAQAGDGSAEGALPRAGTPPVTPGPSVCPEHVLVVEDDEAVLKVLRTMLRRIGCRVTAVESPAEAVAVLEKEGDVDLLITDVVMPGMSGVELSRKAAQIRPDIPVVFMSGYPELPDDADALSEEDVLLQKPFSFGQLLEAIEKVG